MKRCGCRVPRVRDKSNNRPQIRARLGIRLSNKSLAKELRGRGRRYINGQRRRNR